LILHPNILHLNKGLNDLSGSGTLHHAAWYLSKQIPSSHTKRQAIQLARQATVKLPDFKVQEHLGLHRWQRCLVVLALMYPHCMCLTLSTSNRTFFMARLVLLTLENPACLFLRDWKCALATLTLEKRSESS